MTPRPPASDLRIGPGSVPGEPQEPVYGHVCRCGNPASHWHHIVSRSKLSGPYSVVMIDGLNWGNLVPLCFSCHDAVEHVGRREDWADIVLPEKDSDLPYLLLWYEYESGTFSPLSGIPRAGSAPVRGSTERAAPLPSAASLPEPPAQTPGGAKNRFFPTSDSERRDQSGLVAQAPPEKSGEDSVGARTQALSSSFAPPASSPEVPPGSTCPTCNRRVNHPKKEASPVSTTISQRLPVDEKEGMKQLIADTATTIGADELKYPQAKTVEVGMLLIGRYHAEALEIVGEMKAA